MVTPVDVRPSASKAGLTIIHQVTIVEEVTKMYRVNPEMLVKTPKDSPLWEKVTGFVAYLLKRDTEASDAVIARFIGDAPSSVAGHVEYISMRLGKNDPEICDRLYKLRDLILDKIGDDKIVWHQQPRPGRKPAVANLPASPEGKKLVMETVAKLAGVPSDLLREAGTARSTVRARDVILVIFVTHMKTERKSAGNELNRSSGDVDWAIKRMQHPDSQRLDLLVRACTELRLDITEFLSNE